MIRAAALAVVLLAATPAHARLMPEGALTPAPAGWRDYCARHGEDMSCARPIPTIAVGLTPHRRGQLRATLGEIRMIRQVNDPAGTDTWEPAVDQGDCEDLALAARQKLLDRGWPLGAMRLVLALTESGTGHLVLAIDVVEPDARLDTLVIDSRFSQVMPWDRLVALGYFFTKRQSSVSTDWTIVANGIRP